MDWITKADWDCFAAVPVDPNATPGYESLKGCLIWPDEYVEGLSRAGWELLGDLFVARSLLHSGRSISAWPGGSERLEQVWERAIAVGLPWSGFCRTELTEDQRTFLASQVERTVLSAS